MRNISKIIIVISLFLLSACSSEDEGSVSKHINQDVEKVNIVNGENGEQVVITNVSEVNEIVQYLDSISVIPTNNKDLKGYSYKIDLINEKETVNTIILIGNYLKIDSQYFESKNEINTDILKDLMTK
ncbi:hypothetical protein EP18_14015 [Lysinibacillus sphaericus]|nr:hypothetical protein [Lysinibacillus sphaericus]KEK11086.1 hypothetical protein EP18_14015 [Lysinibacillus sphaericus]